MLNIQTKLTPYNFTDCNNIHRIKYIVIHYTGATGKAKDNATYFSSKYLGVSAHYFVDEREIWKCVNDDDISWHCGGGLQGNQYHSLHKIATNSNSIGIEMCVKKGNNGWYFENGTIENTIDLVKYLMTKYNVPLSNVIRHADVTGKQCPEPFCYSESKDSSWADFKALIGGNTKMNINDCEKVGIVTCDTLNIRDYPSTSSGKILASLKAGDRVWINGECDNGWYRADFVNSCGVGYFSGDYIDIEQNKLNHSYDNTVNNLIVDGITTIENMGYWERVLAGTEPVNLDYLRTLLDRYHNKK